MSATLSQVPAATRQNHLAGRLQPGQVYRREDLTDWTASVDRDLQRLVRQGTLHKLAQGLYYAPKPSPFGIVPPTDETLVTSFLRDKDFLIFSPNVYNTLGVGTTQLYNTTWVYNHKRHGTFKLGNRTFDFRSKSKFPHTLTPEFLLIDLLNNLDTLAEERDTLLRQVRECSADMEVDQLQSALDAYGSVATRKRMRTWGLYD